VTTPGGQATTVSTLKGNVQQGDTVAATFTLSAPATLSLVAYTAPNADFDTQNLQEQKVFDATTLSGSGTETLTVHVPDGYFQVDFVAGLPINHLDTNPNVLYHPQDRFIGGAHGGTQPDELPPSAGALTIAVADDAAARKH
jgi:hypothetical protein